MPTGFELVDAQAHLTTTRLAYESALERRDRLVADAIDAGWSYGRVAKTIGIPRGTVQSIARKTRKDGAA